jgi:hypothetical protein
MFVSQVIKIGEWGLLMKRRWGSGREGGWREGGVKLGVLELQAGPKD